MIEFFSRFTSDRLQRKKKLIMNESLSIALVVAGFSISTNYFMGRFNKSLDNSELYIGSSICITQEEAMQIFTHNPEDKVIDEFVIRGAKLRFVPRQGKYLVDAKKWRDAVNSRGFNASMSEPNAGVKAGFVRDCRVDVPVPFYPEI